MAKGWKIAIGIISFLVLFNAIWLVRGMRMMKWKISEPMSQEQQETFSLKARIPSTAGVWERYGVRGLRDPEYMLESDLYRNIDELVKALPMYEANIEQAFENECLETQDIKGVPVARYTVKNIKQASKDGMDGVNYDYGAIIYYYVIQYEDGSLRFIADIYET